MSLFSKIFNITITIVWLKTSSLFAKIALNIPDNLFNKILIPTEYNQDPELLRRSKKLLENKDRGFVYFLLIKNYSYQFGNLKSNEIHVNEILSASNLPSENEIQETINDEIKKLYLNTFLNEKNNFDKHIIDKVFYGNKFRENTGIGQQNEPDDLSKFIREEPYLIFNSTDFEYENLDLVPIIDKIIAQQGLTREEWFKLHTYLEKKIDDFDVICGI